MAQLSNPQHELFAHAMAQGMNPTKAYRSAGYKNKDSRANASRLAGNDNIRQRVTELTEQVGVRGLVESINFTRQWVLNTLGETVLTTKNPMARVRAAELIGSELGMFVRRSERTDIKVDVARMSADQLRELATLIQSRISELSTPAIETTSTSDPDKSNAVES